MSFFFFNIDNYPTVAERIENKVGKGFLTEMFLLLHICIQVHI